MRHFINVLNKKIYGSSAQRYRKRLSILPVIEGGRDIRLHYHTLIDCPRDDLIEGFPDLITTIWRRTLWGHEEVCIKPADSGWISYITKIRTKSNLDESLDWTNCHIG